MVIFLLNIPSLHDHDVLDKAVGAHFVSCGNEQTTQGSPDLLHETE